MSQPAKEVTIEDVVEYEGLKKGQKYKLTGTLMDKETGEPILVDEKPVISETEFTAKKSSGSVKVTFTFDATSLKGKTTVVFEELYQDEMQLAVHTDINDEDQTIYFPEDVYKRQSGSCQSGKGSGNRKCLRLVPVCHCLFKGIPEN